MKTKEYFFDSLTQDVQRALYKRILTFARKGLRVVKVEFYAVQRDSKTYLDHVHGRGQPILRAKVTVEGEARVRRWFWTGRSWRNA